MAEPKERTQDRPTERRGERTGERASAQGGQAAQDKAEDSSSFQVERFLVKLIIFRLLAPSVARSGLLDEAVEWLRQATWLATEAPVAGDALPRKLLAQHMERTLNWTYQVEKALADQSVGDEQAALFYRTRQTILTFLTEHYPAYYTAGDVVRALGARLPHLNRADYEPLLLLYTRLGHIVQEGSRYRAAAPAMVLKREEVEAKRSMLGRYFRAVAPLGDAFLKGRARAVVLRGQLPKDLWDKFWDQLYKQAQQIYSRVVEESNHPERDKLQEEAGYALLMSGPCDWLSLEDSRENP